MRFTSKRMGLSSILAINLLLMLGFSLMLTNSASAALFLLLDDIKGESTDKDHKDWIELSSFSFGVTNTAVGSSSGGAGAGKVDLTELTIIKHTDIASPKLFEATAKGSHFPTAVLDDTKIVSDKSVTFLEFKFQDVLISKFDISGTSDSVPTETLSFNFSKIEMIFNQFDNQGDLIQQITGGPVVNVVPIPGGLLLLGSGIIGLMGIGIRKKSS